MSLLLLIVEAALQVLASWTLAYHLCLLARLPAELIVAPFAAFVLPLFALSARRWSRAISRLRSPTARRNRNARFLLATFALCLVTSGFTLFTSKPDRDDFSFFHRALVQLSRPDAPFTLEDTGHNRGGLPALSLPHAMTSYEHGVAMSASLLGADPLWAYQNAGAFVAAFLLPLVYLLLYRELGLRKTAALTSTGVALLFLILDGNQHQSFGNFGLVRCWQGKVILVMLGVPATLLFAHRFLRRPSLQHFGGVALAGIAAVGLSGSGIFMSPILVAGASAAYLFGYGPSRSRLRRAVLLNLASFYCAGIAVAFFLGFLPQPADTSVWEAFGTTDWRANLDLVIGGTPALLRDLLILVALPWVALKPVSSRFLIGLSLALCLMFANPLMGPFWIGQLHTTAYWRLAYLLPLPLCAGLAVSALPSRGRTRRQALLGAGAVATVALATGIAYKSSVLSGTALKPAGEYRFEPVPLAFSRSALAFLRGRNVLAPPELVVVLGLLDPGMRFESGRPRHTRHVFRNAGERAEGERRVAAQQRVTLGEPSPRLDAAFRSSLRNGVDAVVFESMSHQEVSQLMASEPGRWEVKRALGYVLIFRSDRPRRP